MDITTFTAFMGWLLVVNLGIYLGTAIALMLFRSSIKGLHSRMTGVPIERLDELYFSYLGNFKLAIIVLSLSPYIALRIMLS